MMGARSLLGQITEEELDRVKDGDGVTWREALAALSERRLSARFAPGPRPIPALFRAAVQVELHIEQGPTLEADGLALGIVEHIAGYRRLSVTVTGDARHSGTTPRALRRDALAAAAEMVLEVENLADGFGAAARSTVGNVRVSPGLYNVVPGECELWVEVRHVDSGQLERLARAASDRCHAAAGRRGVTAKIEEKTGQDPTPLSKTLADRAEALAREKGLAFRRMPSGAAHDTMEFARAGAETLMLFVPSRRGISHSPDEFTSTAELWAGVEFASALIGKLAEEHA
jgi:allantoate deiminase